MSGLNAEQSRILGLLRERPWTTNELHIELGGYRSTIAMRLSSLYTRGLAKRGRRRTSGRVEYEWWAP